MDEKRKTDSPVRFPCSRVFIAVVIGFALCAIVMAVALNKAAEEIRAAMGMDTWETGERARELTRSLMGVSLPASARDVEYNASGFLENLLFATARFSIPPQDYEAFIAQATPSSVIGCFVLPLKPEGKQDTVAGCADNDMTITIDRSNPSLWRVTIDIR